MKTKTLSSWLQKTNTFQAEALKVLGGHEDSRQARVIELENSYNALTLLNLKQDDLFRQALRCVEGGLFRAAHVMAWAACEDYIEEKLSEDGLIKLKAARPNWQGATIREMAEYYPEYQFVESLQTLGLTTKNETKAFHALLQKRNECAHPTAYYPKLNETLGYIEEILNRLKRLSTKHL